MSYIKKTVITFPFKFCFICGQPVSTNVGSSSHCIRKRKYVYTSNACSFSKCVVLNCSLNKCNFLSRFDFLAFVMLTYSEPVFRLKMFVYLCTFSIWIKNVYIILMYLNSSWKNSSMKNPKLLFVPTKL